MAGERARKGLEQQQGPSELCCRVLCLQVRASIKTAQEAECERVKADIQRFSTAVAQYTGTVYTSRGFFAWATGVETATADCDKVWRCVWVMEG
jgi:hypothetical protein